MLSYADYCTKSAKKNFKIFLEIHKDHMCNHICNHIANAIKSWRKHHGASDFYHLNSFSTRMRAFLINYVSTLVRVRMFIADVYDYTCVQNCCLYKSVKKRNKNMTLLLMPVHAHTRDTVEMKDPIFYILRSSHSQKEAALAI